MNLKYLLVLGAASFQVAAQESFGLETKIVSGERSVDTTTPEVSVTKEIGKLQILVKKKVSENKTKISMTPLDLRHIQSDEELPSFTAEGPTNLEINLETGLSNPERNDNSVVLEQNLLAEDFPEDYGELLKRSIMKSIKGLGVSQNIPFVRDLPAGLVEVEIIRSAKNSALGFRFFTEAKSKEFVIEGELSGGKAHG